MPYDTPYNRMIANEQERKNRRYADMNAYSNEMYNTNMPFSEVYKELRLPVRQFRPQRAYISNYDGGITNRNMEGSAGVLRGMMRPAVLNEDVRPIGRGFSGGINNAAMKADLHRQMSLARDMAKAGRGHECMCSDSCSCSEGEMEGCGDFEENPELAGIYEGMQAMDIDGAMAAPQPPQSDRVSNNPYLFVNRNPQTAGPPMEPPRLAPSAREAASRVRFPSEMRQAQAEVASAPASEARKKGKRGQTPPPADFNAYIDKLVKETGRSREALIADKKVMKEFHRLEAEYKGSGMSGGFLPFLASMAIPYLAKKAYKAVTGGKRRRKAKVAVEPSAIVEAEAPKPAKGKRAPSKWIMFVKKFASDKKINYRDALRHPEIKSAYAKVKGKGVSGGSVLSGPSNDPVNKGKITGLGRAEDLGEPQGTGTGFLPSTGLHWEGASLGAGAPKKKGRGKGKKTGSSLFKTAPIVPLDVKSGVPPTEEQIEGISNIVEEPTGLGKKKAKKAKKEGGMLKTLMPGSSFSGGKKKREPNAWIKHVQAYAKENKVSYKDAIKQARASYKKK